MRVVGISTRIGALFYSSYVSQNRVEFTFVVDLEMFGWLTPSKQVKFVGKEREKKTYINRLTKTMPPDSGEHVPLVCIDKTLLSLSSSS